MHSRVVGEHIYVHITSILYIRRYGVAHKTPQSMEVKVETWSLNQCHLERTTYNSVLFYQD